MQRYFFKEDRSPWREISKIEFIRQERAAGFHPTHIATTDPEYDLTCATASFSRKAHAPSERCVEGVVIDTDYFRPQLYQHFDDIAKIIRHNPSANLEN